MRIADGRDAVRDPQAQVLHWSFAEPVSYEEAYDSARNRHPEKGWPALGWFDLWDQVVRQGRARPRAHRNVVGRRQVGGLGAMVGAWWCDDEAKRLGVPMPDIDLKHEIADYNEVDCKVMMEVLPHLREHH